MSGVLSPGEIGSLRDWMESEAVIVPEGWLEACLDWLSEQSDDRMTFQQLREAVYQQWLHSDFTQFECPILPDQEAVMQETLLLEGELCLQISALIKIGESYYGQLRRFEGNLSKDLPDLEIDRELDDDVEEASIDPSFQLSNVATQSFPPSDRPTRLQTANTPTYALHLTDGVRTIKAVEVGSVYSTTATSPEEWFRIGAKVRLKGPLKLRKGVLLLPCGTISNPAVTSQSPNSQCCFLGGEVEFTEAGERRMEALLQRELLMKLNLPPDNPPEWFPGQRHLPTEANINNANDNIANSTIGVAPQLPERNVADEAREGEDLFDEDDLLLASAVEDFESLAAAAVEDGTTNEATTGQEEESVPGADPNEVAVDAALEEINFSPQVDTESITPHSSSFPKTLVELPCRPPSNPIIHKPQQSSSKARPSAQRSRSDIRRYFSTTSTLHSQRQQHSAMEARARMPQFAYLQDIYYDRQQRRSGGSEVHSVRGMLISVQSQLEHHEGQRWSLTVRLTDGTAVLDADMEDELLHRLIGLSALEVEAMKQLGRQKDEGQKQRLREVVNAFQMKLCHFSGIFEVIFPDAAITSATSCRPRIRQFQLLDQQWPSFLQDHQMWQDFLLQSNLHPTACSCSRLRIGISTTPSVSVGRRFAQTLQDLTNPQLTFNLRRPSCESEERERIEVPATALWFILLQAKEVHYETFLISQRLKEERGNMQLNQRWVW
ncbi:RecQ-mediated genome instability protein 1 [Taenia crassiceps]|uniref:RecQ-mediated genome instability protein 1 n=1 Tax=Taenia crassiceps TaxID=6207 RepID=A0ABR4Q6D6_9CEST